MGDKAKAGQDTGVYLTERQRQGILTIGLFKKLLTQCVQNLASILKKETSKDSLPLKEAHVSFEPSLVLQNGNCQTCPSKVP